jgi:hypothetical protein
VNEFEAKVSLDSSNGTVSFEIPNDIFQNIQVEETQRKKQEESGVVFFTNITVTTITFPAPMAQAFTKFGFEKLSGNIGYGTVFLTLGNDILVGLNNLANWDTMSPAEKDSCVEKFIGDGLIDLGMIGTGSLLNTSVAGLATLGGLSVVATAGVGLLAATLLTCAGVALIDPEISEKIGKAIHNEIDSLFPADSNYTTVILNLAGITFTS